MNLTKSQDFFSPLDVKHRCHIIGCGSVGSTVAENLVRLGIKNISLYDFDTVSSHNIANQMFFHSDIKRLKVDALKEMLCRINPQAEPGIQIYPVGWTEFSYLSGYVFLCLDNIDLRRKIATANKQNQSIVAMFDFRTRLLDAQHYAAEWKNPALVKNFLASMDFTHEEAKANTPVTACNIAMGVAPTVRVICSLGIANFMNYINKGELKKIMDVNIFGFDISAY